MSGKKRNTEKKLRRELEVLKAQLKSNATASYFQQSSVVSSANPSSSSDKKASTNYELSIVAIKRDLMKTVLFAVFALFAVLVLKVKGI